VTTRIPPDLAAVAVVAVAQGVVGVLRALQWVRIGSDLVGRGALMLPLVGSIAIARGAVVAAIAVLYVLFAAGALGRSRWAPRAGFAAAGLNGLAVVNLLAAGEPVAPALAWAVVPVGLSVYLLSPAARRAFERPARP
jgi:hypothetical protein